ncbi:putative Bro-N domain-containing protein [Yalta virus]|nr:putative Bro-N domain-containing protein [Yalta virus]
MNSTTNSAIHKTMSFNEHSLVLKGIVDNITENKNFICKKLYYDDNVYYSAQDLFKFLKYDNNKFRFNDILEQIREQDKFTLKQLKQKYSLTSKPRNGICFYDPDCEVIKNIGKEEDIHIFVNTKAFYYMMGRSSNNTIQPFINFVYYELLPFLDKRYKDIMVNPEKNTEQILDDLRIIKNENKDIKTSLNNIIGIEKNIKELQLELTNQIKILHDMLNLLNKKQKTDIIKTEND